METYIAEQLQLAEKQVKGVFKLLEQGATIPFMARYRKEVTGGLSEVELEKIVDLQEKQLALAKRKEAIIKQLEQQNVTDPQILQRIKECTDLVLLEDLYLPYKPKRKTRAASAKALGLEPLAKIIMAQRENSLDRVMNRFTSHQLLADDALKGARDIIAEWISEHGYARNSLRKLFRRGLLQSKVQKDKQSEAATFQDYFDYEEPIHRIPSHRFLAINRGEHEQLLKVKLVVDQEQAHSILKRIFIKTNLESELAHQIMMAITDSFKRLLAPSLENEIRQQAKINADEQAIELFAKNVKQLLLAPPLGAKCVMALDPGFRTGCKLVCLDEQGVLLKHDTIFPHPPQGATQQASEKVLIYLKKYRIEAIAIGNGTAGRETEQFIRSIVGDQQKAPEIYVVSEAGASIYSASQTGREEFPQLDATVRGAISIGRRLMDPLAELVKIDPKSIGVGQYQHDVDQAKLKNSLQNTVSSAVNQVGVNINTASEHLLQYVAGIGPTLARNIIKHRSESGAISNRSILLEVKGLGKHAYQQSAGFLRIKGGDQPLDASAVHPERYDVVRKMATQLHCDVAELIGNEPLVQQIKLEPFISDDLGQLTLKDILEELAKPGLDPRSKALPMQFDDNIRQISDLHVGMKLTGYITNLTKFGAFVDIGLKENGLIHKSKMADQFVADPADVLQLSEQVEVVVIGIEIERKRIQLSMKGDDFK